ncbi:MAG: DUF2357 domain-containing protein [Armatimonadetes bacterium]|nr:DUF2357 domain-containing protein [Armatimonadota bacterium]
MMSNPYDGDWRQLLTEVERARMLDDIARVSLAVGRRLFPDRAWDDLDIAAGSLAARKSPMERLWFIERLLPDLTRVVHRIMETPVTLPAREARVVAPPLRARRVETAAILTAVRRGHAERRLEERATAVTPDTPENRAVKAFLAALRRDAAAIGDIAEAVGEEEICRAARTVAGRLRGLIALPLWEDVTDDALAWRQPPTHRMLADARYARLAEAMRRYRQSFQFDWANPLFSLPSRETWRLYEAWGLFQALEALLALGYAPVADVNAAANALFAVHQERLTFALVKGVESRIGLLCPDGRRLGLFYNRAYPQRVRSLSRTMQPDIAIERIGPPAPNSAGATWILDPKFKTYAAAGSEGDDMDQMHAYRDAVVDAGGGKPVARAWCLYAGGVDGGARPLIAYGPPASSIVGALHLRPGDAGGFERLCHLLAGWLG